MYLCVCCTRSAHPARRQPAMPIPPIPPPFPVIRPPMPGPSWRPLPPGPAAPPPMVVQRQSAGMVRGPPGSAARLDTSMDDAIVVHPSKRSKDQWRKVSSKKLVRQPDDNYYDEYDTNPLGWTGYSGYITPSEYRNGPPPRPWAAFTRR